MKVLALQRRIAGRESSSFAWEGQSCDDDTDWQMLRLFVVNLGAFARSELQS